VKKSPFARAGVVLAAASFAVSACSWTRPTTPAEPEEPTTTTTAPTPPSSEGPTTTTTAPPTEEPTTTTTAPDDGGGENPTSPGGDFAPDGFSLVFSDEFDGGELDRGTWCTRYIYGGGATPVDDPECAQNGEGTLDFLNDEQQRYVDVNAEGEEMHVVADGVLSLRATETGYDDYAAYQSSMIRSKEVFEPTGSTEYYLTTRVRMPDVIGTWPAFWLNSDRAADGSTSWPPEIDILEGAYNGQDDRADMLHQGGIIRGQQTASGDHEYSEVDESFDTQWNNYHADSSLRDVWIEVGLKWTDSEACFYVDGLQTACEAYRWVQNEGQDAPPAHVLLNLAIGGNWAGRYGIADDFPTSFDVDHVRVYRNG
jgi:beta-glucanase (GH16 family)